MVQIDGPSRQVFIKFESAECMAIHLSATIGTCEYLHNNGELSKVLVAPTGIGYREVRIAGLPPEVPDSVIQAALDKYGAIRGYCRQSWSKQYRYQKSNGVRVVTNLLKKHLPSVMTIAGTRTLITYDGQEMTCFTCHERGHLSKHCPHKRSVQPVLQHQQTDGHTSTWARVVQQERLPADAQASPPSMDVDTPLSPLATVVETIPSGATSRAEDILLPDTAHQDGRFELRGSRALRVKDNPPGLEAAGTTVDVAVDQVGGGEHTGGDSTDTDGPSDNVPLVRRTTRLQKRPSDDAKKRQHRTTGTADPSYVTIDNSRVSGPDLPPDPAGTSPNRKKKNACRQTGIGAWGAARWQTTIPITNLSLFNPGWIIHTKLPP
jgi:hypothetical protein